MNHRSCPVSAPMAIAVGLLVFRATLSAAEAPVVLLWPEGAPGSAGKTGDEVVRITDDGEHILTNVHRPSLTVYLPPQASGTAAAVLVIPGGGHRELWMDHEGHNVGRWLSEHGIAAFVLKYRLARQEGSTYTLLGHSLVDAQRALRLIRHRASEWRVDPGRIGVIGFSAGGELAALAAAHGDGGRPQADDPIERESSRVAYQALIYPGNSAGIAIARDKDAPPAFLLCGESDRPDIALGLAQVYLRFKEAGVSTELHIYAGAGHGFGLRATNQGPVRHWPDRFLEWLTTHGALSK